MPTLSREALKHVALIIAGAIAMWCAFVLGWCAWWKIYVDVPMLLVLSNLVTGIVSAITTLLVGRTLAQLNSAEGDTTMTQTTQTVTKPKASVPDHLPAEVKIVNTPESPANVQEVQNP